MKTRRIVGILCLLLFVIGSGWLLWNMDESRRTSFASLQSFNNALHSADRDALLATIVLPQSLHGRTASEQAEFITKSLRDEISLEGIAALKRHGDFGPLPRLFPAEAAAWAGQAGVAPENCLAFRMEKNGLRAEIVLLSTQSGYRIIRCNNVKQMADTKP